MNNLLIRFIGSIVGIAFAFAAFTFFIDGFGTTWAVQTGFDGEFWWGITSIVLLVILSLAIVVGFHPDIANWIGSIAILAVAIVVGIGIWQVSINGAHFNWGHFGLGAACCAVITVTAGAFVGFGFILRALFRPVENA